MKATYPYLFAAALLGLVAGLALGAGLQGSAARASQTFGPDEVKSVPRTFVEGGDRNYTALKDILQETRNNGEKLERVAAQMQTLNQTMAATAARIDISNRLLQAQLAPLPHK